MNVGKLLVSIKKWLMAEVDIKEVRSFTDEEFHKPLGKIRVDRLSRHLYDVHQLLKVNAGWLSKTMSCIKQL